MFEHHGEDFLEVSLLGGTSLCLFDGLSYVEDEQLRTAEEEAEVGFGEVCFPVSWCWH